MARKASQKGRIDVVVRKRPLNLLETTRGERDIVVCNYDCGTIREFKCKIDGTNFIEEHEFKVDRFYDETADNELIYNEYVKPLVELAFRENKTCSCFTYGQTGSGKTFTMIGSRIPGNFGDSEGRVVAGIYEYAANDIYRILQEPEFAGKIEVVISFYEIYCGKLYDLLQKRKLLESLENGKREMVIKDLSVRTVNSKEELIGHMLEGLNLRRIGQNSQNDHSSRSHALLRIELKNKQTHKTQGSISFVDLAGSERGADSIAMSKQTQIDGAGINRSLLALKECIRAMDLDKIHIPFRNSELTKVLRDVFVGDSRSVMIANICPSGQSCEQTLNTLRYASKVKNFKANSTTTSTQVSLASFNTFVTPENSSGTTTKPYTRFQTMPNSNITPNLLQFKNTSSSRFTRDLTLTIPSLLPFSDHPDSTLTLDKMDVDPVSTPIESTSDKSTSTLIPNLDHIKRIFQSQSTLTMANLNLVLDSIELNDSHKAIYNYLVDQLPMSELDGSLVPSNSDINNHSPNPHHPNQSQILNTYHTYSQVSSLFKLIHNSTDPVENIKNILKLEFKLLLSLRQLLYPD